MATGPKRSYLANDPFGRRPFLAGGVEGFLWLTLPALGSCVGAPARADPIAAARAEGVTRPILLAIAAGITAPNPHNAQPWRFRIVDDLAMELHVDTQRLLPDTDPPSRQILIGHGTFLEHLDLGAREMGHTPGILPFPQGALDPGNLGARPVARVTLGPAGAAVRDPLYAAIPRRITNRAVYDATPVSAAKCEGLLASARLRTARAGYTVDPARLRELGEILVRAFEIETNTFRTYDETRRWFRFRDDEIARSRDGLSLPANGVTGFRGWVASRFVLSNETWHSPSNRRTAIALFRDSVRSGKALVWLTTSGNAPADWLRAGRDYARLHLAATAGGLAMHPMSQALEEYPEMREIRVELRDRLGVQQGESVQMLARIGYSDFRYVSRRRPVSSMLSEAPG